MMDQRESTFGIPLLRNEAVSQPWAVTIWQIDDAHQTPLPWPLPGWSTFFEHDLFLSIWKEYLKLGEPKPNLPDAKALELLLFGWIDAATSVLRLDGPVGLPHGTLQPPWEGLIKRLEGLYDQAPRQAARAPLIRDWFSRLALLLMPEMIDPLPKKAQESFAASTKLTRAWQREKTQIKAGRKHSTTALTENGMRTLAQKFELSVPKGFPPSLQVRTKKPKPANEGQEAQQQPQHDQQQE
jgi:hypothetical protein